MISVDFNSGIWSQERAIAHVTGIAAITNYVKLVIGTITANYYGDSSGNLDIDLSDVVRTGFGSFTLQEFDSSNVAQGSAVNKTFLYKGRINPSTFIIPSSSDGSLWQTAGVNYIHPPMRTIEAIGTIPTQFELYDTNSSAASTAGYYIVDDQTEGAYHLISNLQNKFSLVPTAKKWSLFGAGSTKFVRLLTPKICGELYACVEWVSRAGVIKRCTWKVRNVKYETNGSTSYALINNGFNVHKGQLHSFDIMLDVLTMYDYWYYSDIVTSDDVRVAFSDSEYNSTTDRLSESCRVDVTTKAATMPNGDAVDFNTLTVNVNYKRYDEI